ncbi:MAG: cupin domain-containing protein [Nitrosomonadales bacterium]|nr:cupin domain-containing protein [Nitrosomonadales bacterium]
MRAWLLVGALLCCREVWALDADDAKVKVTQLMKTTQSWDGKPLTYPAGQAEVTGLIVEIAPGAETGWHLHPVPSFALLLEGSLEVLLEDGRIRRLEAGDSLAEVVSTWHNGRSVGTVPVRIVVFYTGAVGQPLTVKRH